MLLKKILPLVKSDESKEKVKHLESYVEGIEKRVLDVEDVIEELTCENKTLKASVLMLEENNKFTLSDIYSLAQNLAAIYSIISEHNKIIEDNGLDKKIIYH